MKLSIDSYYLLLFLSPFLTPLVISSVIFPAALLTVGVISSMPSLATGMTCCVEKAKICRLFANAKMVPEIMHVAMHTNIPIITELLLAKLLELVFAAQ